jgi:hypothetical protein
MYPGSFEALAAATAQTASVKGLKRTPNPPAGRSDRFLVTYLMGPGASDPSPQPPPDPDLLAEIEGHRSALLLGDLRLAPTTPVLSGRS